VESALGTEIGAVAISLTLSLLTLSLSLSPYLSLSLLIDLDGDAPLMVSKQLLTAAQSVGMSTQDLSDILPTALIPGYGEKVCMFLLSLCGIALNLTSDSNL
jgi:hypothetical protein